MENASKALIMAAEVLIGLMVISIGVYLFQLFGQFSSDKYQEMADRQIAEFNQQFTKFYGMDKDGTPIKCTIHDIMSLANLAQKHNLQNELIEPVTRGSMTTYQIKHGVTLNNSSYIQINLGNMENIELKTTSQQEEMIKQNDLTQSATGEISDIKYYQCIEYQIDENTKLVNLVKFKERP